VDRSPCRYLQPGL